MDERGGVGAHAVERTAPRHEIELAGFPRSPAMPEGLQQRRDGLAGQRSSGELRLREEEDRLGRLSDRIFTVLVRDIAELGPEAPRLGEGRALLRRSDGIRAGPSDQLVEQLGRIGSGSEERSVHVDDGGRSTSPVAVTFRLAASSSGPLGAHSCHARMTLAAAEYGHVRWTFVASGAWTVRECPPLRIAISRPYRPVNEIASATSCAVAHDMKAFGVTSWNRALKGRLDAS